MEKLSLSKFQEFQLTSSKIEGGDPPGFWMEEDSVAGTGSVDSRNEAGFSVYDEWYDYNDNGIIYGNETWTGYGGYKPK